MGCMGAKDEALELWRSLQRGVQDSPIRKRLQETMTRLIDASQAAGRRGIDLVRNTVGSDLRIFGRVEERAAQVAPPQISEPRYQPLQLRAGPIDYLKMCESDKASASGGSLHPEGTLTIPRPPFSARELEHYLIRAIHSRDLNDQLENVPLIDETQSTSVANQPFNKPKNRYKNNVPYDYNRVVLKNRDDADYINASYISSPRGKHCFIAAQGPKGAKMSTVEDFWLMVWQNNTNVIIMVANLVEGGREKVSKYWPDTLETTQHYGKVEVRMTAEENLFNFTTRRFLVSWDTSSREVIQYQYTAWPDHSVPGNAIGAANMIKSVNKLQWSGPPVIHCSAGLGRSGTILLVLVLLESLKTKGHFHPPDSLRALRMCRANMLDNQLQYRFTHQMLLEVLFCSKTRFALSKLSDKNFWVSINSSLHEQFQEVRNFPIDLTYNWARAQDPLLNRDNTVLPADGRQVALVMPQGHAGVQYINAVLVRSYSMQEAFIVTEHPLIHTISRAWWLAYMTKASAWVFLHDHRYQTEEDFPSVFPNGCRDEFEGITVQVDGKVDKPFYTETFITLRAHVPHTMPVLQFKNWHPSKEVPDDAEAITSLTQRLMEIRRAAPHSITMVSCCDGYSASGVFVTLQRLVAQANLTRLVDVFRTVQSVRFDRPQFIKSKRQYLYLLEALAHYQKRKRTQILPPGQKTEEQAKMKEEGNAHTARSGVQSDNELMVQTRKSMRSNEHETCSNNERREERKQMESHMARKSRAAMEARGRETLLVNEKKEERRKHESGESNSRKEEDGKKSRNAVNTFEEKGQIETKQNPTGKRQDVGGSAKAASQYERIWESELHVKTDIYEHVWEAKEGHL